VIARISYEDKWNSMLSHLA